MLGPPHFPHDDVELRIIFSYSIRLEGSELIKDELDFQDLNCGHLIFCERILRQCGND